MPFHQLLHIILVVFANELTNHLFGDVATDVLIIVALTLHFLLIYFTKDSKSAAVRRIFDLLIIL
jgi:hypothetical protein